VQEKEGPQRAPADCATSAPGRRATRTSASARGRRRRRGPPPPDAGWAVGSAGFQWWTGVADAACARRGGSPLGIQSFNPVAGNGGRGVHQGLTAARGGVVLPESEPAIAYRISECRGAAWRECVRCFLLRNSVPMQTNAGEWPRPHEARRIGACGTGWPTAGCYAPD
jgi:hypothetical protein